MSDLTTEEGVVLWAMNTYENSHDDYYVVSEHQDTATAERLALGQRVLEIVERDAAKYDDIEDILAEAKGRDE